MERARTILRSPSSNTTRMAEKSARRSRFCESVDSHSARPCRRSRCRSAYERCSGIGTGVVMGWFLEGALAQEPNLLPPDERDKGRIIPPLPAPTIGALCRDYPVVAVLLSFSISERTTRLDVASAA